VVGGRVVVTQGHVLTGFEPLSVALGVLVFPAALLGWQWVRARNTNFGSVPLHPATSQVSLHLESCSA